jgi:hypothetical protein
VGRPRNDSGGAERQARGAFWRIRAVERRQRIFERTRQGPNDEVGRGLPLFDLALRGEPSILIEQVQPEADERSRCGHEHDEKQHGEPA